MIQTDMFSRLLQLAVDLSALFIIGVLGWIAINWALGLM